MNIVFVGNFQVGPGGEPADEVHITREFESAGNKVFKIPRDEWREYVIEKSPQGKYNVPELKNQKIDVAIICKWHHFYDASFITMLRSKYNCPVFYWVWDFMEGHTVGDWHMNMAQAADLYLSGEIGLAHWYKQNKVKFYYLQFDVVDGAMPYFTSSEKKYNVIYMGSCINQGGRLDMLEAIGREIPITVFGHDYEVWREHGFDAYPAVYGAEANKIISESHIILGTSCGPRCFGYWSNRVGRTLFAGGFLMQWYTPGMELFMSDSCEYFSTPDEAIRKIRWYLDDPTRILERKQRNIMPREMWTSEYRVRQLLVLIDRYLNDPHTDLWMLP